jgi:hypothetical protein
MPRGRQPEGEHALSNAERQARYRARREAQQPAPVVRYRRPADRRTRAQRWHDTVTWLVALQAEWGPGKDETEQPSVVTSRRRSVPPAKRSSGWASSMIRITGIGDHDRPDCLITMTGIRNDSLGASIRRRKPSDQRGSTPSGCWRADAGHRAELNVSHSTISRLGAVNPEKTSYR